MPFATEHDTLAAIELISVPAGLCALDALVKEAPVHVIFAGDIDPGRFLVVFGGDVASCEASLQRGAAEVPGEVTETLLLPFAHERLRAALHGHLLTSAEAQTRQDALGILQCHTPIAILAAVDRALKAAETQLLRLRFATELGGQGHAVLAGDQHDIEAALIAAETGAPAGTVVQTRRLARPAVETCDAAAQRLGGARALSPLEP
ncbi:MAG: BMC domain-containing protein [Deltaproteobacteria bacterium]|nr:BMC domain-containing protein [Deltaproteobacteria bacterium]